MKLPKKIISSVKTLNYLATGLSIRLVKWTGKAPQYIHPKHLIENEDEYAKYFSKEDEVLDIGCANGQRDFKLAPHVKKITAFEYDKTLLSQAREWQKKNDIGNIDFLELSAEEPWPFKDWSFDKLLFLDVLEHLNNRDLALRECYRVLRPGGKMVVAVPNSETSWKKLQKEAGLQYYSDSDHKIEYSKEEIVAELTKNGFIIEELKPIVYDYPFLGLIDLAGGFNLRLYRRLAGWKKKVALARPEESIGFMLICKK